MLRSGWNFHNDVAIPLEGAACELFGDIGRPVNKNYDADAIEGGSFVEVMIMLLRAKTGNSNECEDIDEFVRECAPYLGKRGNCIDPEVADKLYRRFRNLFY